MSQKELGNRILIVDDHEDFLQILQSALTAAGYEAVSSSDGESAKALFDLGGIDLILTDLHMPKKGVSGLDLLAHVKSLLPTPVVLMTGFAQVLETHRAHELGADDFLAKPFNTEELLSVVSKYVRPQAKGAFTANFTSPDSSPTTLPSLPPPPARASDSSPGLVSEAESSPNWQQDQFCKISIEEFVSGKTIQYDIFVRLSDAKFVKIAHRGEDIPLEKIRVYQARQIRDLYLRKEDFRRYVGFNLKITQSMGQNDQVSMAKRLKFVRHTQAVIMESLFFTEVDPESFAAASTLVETTVALVADNQAMYELLEGLSSHPDALYAHSLGVSLYSLMIARALKWNSSAANFKVALGALLHDIGKKDMDPALLRKARADLTAAELHLLDTHPARGREVLSAVEGVPEDILQIVSQHHENRLGTGYPERLPLNRLNPLGRLVAVANEFCNLVIEGGTGPLLSPAEAFRRLSVLKKDTLDPDFVAALGRIFRTVPSG